MKRFSLSLLLVLILCSPSFAEFSAGFEGLDTIIYIKAGTSQQYKFQVLSGDSVLPESEYTVQTLEVNTDTLSADTSIAEFSFDSSSRYLTLSAKSNGLTKFHVGYYSRIYLVSTGRTHGYSGGTDTYITVTATGEPDSDSQTGTATPAGGGGGCMMSHSAVILAALLFLLADKYFVV